MQCRYPDQPWDPKDIHNTLLKRREIALDGLTPTQALVRDLRTHAVKHFLRQDQEGHITGLIWTFPWCEEMWRRHCDVLSMDCTYKTNRFKMPFLNVTGVTSVSSTFNIAFALLNKEDEATYQWAVERLEELRQAVGADSPPVVLTDY